MNSQTMLTPQALARLSASGITRNRSKTSPIVDFFAALSQDIRDQINTEHVYKQGEILCREGEDGDAMFLIWSGQAAIIKGDLDAPTLIDIRGSGEMIGEMALLENAPRSASVVALDDLYVLRVGRDNFQQLLISHPPLALNMLSILSARLRSASQDSFVHARAEEEMVHELETAGRIQARFLPETVPTLPGWDIAVELISVWQTSGDYYDFIPLPNGKLGFLVADVSDKGTGAALYMTLTRTLIRTYAALYPDDPGLALLTANERILVDTTSDQFVTAFYGILDPQAGTMLYANAGHNPPLLLRAHGDCEQLDKTGIPLGLFVGRKWRQNTLQFEPGDMLIVYTDGVSEARNLSGEEFGIQKLIDCARNPCPDGSASQTHAALMRSIREFVGEAEPFDDMTLLVAVRTTV